MSLTYHQRLSDAIPTFTATLGDLGATATGLLVLGTFTVGSCFGMNRKDYLDFRFSQLIQAQNYKDTNSISDVLGEFAEGMEEAIACCPKDKPYYPVIKAISDGSEWVSDTSEVVDIAVDAYDIVSGLKDYHDNIDEWINGKAYTPEEFAEAFDKKSYWEIVDYIEDANGPIIKAKGSPVEMISKIVSERTGIPLLGWTDSSKFDGNVLKTASTLWSYGEKFIPDPVNGLTDSGDVWDVAFSKYKDTKFLKDIFDFARDLDDLAAKSSTIEPVGDGSS